MQPPKNYGTVAVLEIRRKLTCGSSLGYALAKVSFLKLLTKENILDAKKWTPTLIVSRKFF